MRAELQVAPNTTSYLTIQPLRAITLRSGIAKSRKNEEARVAEI